MSLVFQTLEQCSMFHTMQINDTQKFTACNFCHTNNYSNQFFQQYSWSAVDYWLTLHWRRFVQRTI